jgi:N-acetylneuraminate lyase
MVSAVIPGFYDYKVREVSQYYRSIARVGLPVIVYYLGGSSRVFTAQDFVDEMGSIEGIVGLKYTATDLFTMQTIQELSRGRLSVWCGQDQMALPALLMNATGVIGSSYNYIPELFVALYGAYMEGDIRLARDLQFEANCISFAVKKYGNIPAYKAVLELRGLDVGDCRPPLLPLRTEEREKLKTVTARYAQWLGEIELKDKLSPVATS